MAAPQDSVPPVWYVWPAVNECEKRELQLMAVMDEVVSLVIMAPAMGSEMPDSN